MQTITVENTPATQAIVDAVVKAGFVGIDDHHYQGKDKIEIGGVAVHVRTDGKQTVVALFTSKFSDYYSMNQVSVDKNGTFHVTRNACAGVIVGASMDVVNDVKLNREGFDWTLVEEKPFLHPGHLVNIVAAPL